MKLEESNIAVTGGASGMGRHFCLQLAQAGANVAACDMNEDGLNDLVEESANLPGTIRGYVANVANEESVISFFDKAWADFGGLTGLVNNAGIFRDGLLVKKDRESGEIRKMSLKNWQMVIDVDLTGPFLCTREFAERHISNGNKQGVIVNISSIARYGNQGQSNYSAAKAGLVADTVTWAKELARYGIRTGAIAPGFVDTPILQGMRPDVLEGMLKAVPLRRVGAPEEIFAGVKFIIECDYFTGRCIDIDGGMRI
jgi:3-oxoacyl-[acyl-carrier protein] reductase